MGPTWILFPHPKPNYSANLSLVSAGFGIKETIRRAGLISDSCLIFHLHLCYFLMSFSFFAATLYHTSLVPFILSSGKSGGPFSLLKNLYLWRTKKGGKGKQWGQTISFLPGATHLLFRVLSVRGDLVLFFILFDAIGKYFFYHMYILLFQGNISLWKRRNKENDNSLVRLHIFHILF